MSKSELIDAIRQHNHSVAPEFLNRFTESDLKAYLDRVCLIRRPGASAALKPTLQAHEEFVVA